jgi:hypothetical protein
MIGKTKLRSYIASGLAFRARARATLHFSGFYFKFLDAWAAPTSGAGVAKT